MLTPGRTKCSCLMPFIKDEVDEKCMVDDDDDAMDDDCCVVAALAMFVDAC